MALEWGLELALVTVMPLVLAWVLALVKEPRL